MSGLLQKLLLSFGLHIKDANVEKRSSKRLSNGDVITLKPSKEFTLSKTEACEIPRKRMKMDNITMLNNAKKMFEESQSYEIKHIEERIQNAKQMQSTSNKLKEQLQVEMDQKIKEIESGFFALRRSHFLFLYFKGRLLFALKGDNLIEERDIQLAEVKNQMKGKIAEVMEQIKKRNETELDLLKEYSSLKERAEFLAELSRKSYNQDMLDKLEAKMREQEDIRIKEKQEFQEMLKRETEQLRLAKEKKRVLDRETEAERRRKQAEQTFEVISTLNEQLEKILLYNMALNSSM